MGKFRQLQTSNSGVDNLLIEVCRCPKSLTSDFYAGSLQTTGVERSEIYHQF